MNRSINPARTLPVLLLAVVVLLVAMASGATAGKLITGKDIKNGTVTGKDFKNGSVGFADLASSARTTLKWDTNGSTDADVPGCTDTALDDCPNLLAVGIVPGSQLVTFSGAVDNTNGIVPSIVNRCGLVQGGDVLTEHRFALAANGQPGEVQAFTLQQVISVPDTSLPVTVRCTEQGGEALRLVEPRLTSVKVDKVG